MDDMLIVRMSDRSRERFARNRRALPLGGSLGLVLGLPITIALLSSYNGDFPPYLGIGAAIGIVFFAFFGRFLAPHRKKRPMANLRYYDGMPFPAEDEDEADEEPTSEEKAS